MNEEVAGRRAPSPHLVAMRNERKLLAPVRQQIGELQKRAAFIEARARSTRSHDAEAAATEIDEIRRAVQVLQREIEDLVQGSPGLGPTEDCRKALVQVLARLPVA